MRPRRYFSAEDLDRMAWKSALMDEALRLLDGGAPPLALAHLQFAIEVLRGAGPLQPGSATARSIERQFAAVDEPAQPAND